MNSDRRCTDPGEALYAVRDRSVINEREAGDLFDELAQCPEPLIFGLGEGPFDPEAFDAKKATKELRKLV